MSDVFVNIGFEPSLSEDGPCPLSVLPEIKPQFFIPKLADKPQNPIMDTLRLTRTSTRVLSPNLWSMLPPDLKVIAEDQLIQDGEAENAFWELPSFSNEQSLIKTLSWDALRMTFRRSVSSSPFLSEQSVATFASARYYVRPPLRDPNIQLVYVNIRDLFQSLVLTTTGISSPLYIWNQTTERFELRDIASGKVGQIVIVGKDEVVSTSLVKRFLTSGNLLRRLENLTTTNKGPSRSTSALHAFLHAISTILTYLRTKAENMMLLGPQDAHEYDARLTALWMRYEDVERILITLASLCLREEHVDPPDYQSLPTSGADLLSSVYQHVSDHVESSSPRIIIASLAYVLTVASRSYFQQLSALIGLNTPGSRSILLTSERRRQRDDFDGFHTALPDDDVPEVQTEGQGEDEPSFATFIASDLAESLSRARRSLQLLRAAQPNHSLLNPDSVFPDVEWGWTEDSLSGDLDRVTVDSFSGNLNETSNSVLDVTDHGSEVMQAFKVFELDPGKHSLLVPRGSLLAESIATAALSTFLDTFPPSLPSVTPTLNHLTSRVLSPLSNHASLLSEALVAVFLDPSTHLHLHTHLTLLRSYLLCTSHAFKARLQAALFSDNDEVKAPVAGSRAHAVREVRSRSRPRSSNALRQSTGDGATKKWAVGLAPTLAIENSWPPGGADLSFHLRTVIVDSIADSRFEADDEAPENARQASHRKILEEAEWRLGFAIRDLPAGTGRERWLNPLTIEAMDFLYMDYSPPHPLDVLITPAILSKYHRVFAFNLRLMRVENVVHALFRLTRDRARPLFPTLAAPHKLLLHFRFVAQAFTSALAAYVYDVAIGATFDAFLAKLAPSASAFADVFALADAHSAALDDILSACLLRSGQKAVGDVLRACMELVLALGILAGELRGGRVEEYDAAPLLDDLWARFRARMTTLVKVLRALVEKDAAGSSAVLDDYRLHILADRAHVAGVTGKLHQLLLRLDVSDWWGQRK